MAPARQARSISGRFYCSEGHRQEDLYRREPKFVEKLVGEDRIATTWKGTTKSRWKGTWAATKAGRRGGKRPVEKTCPGLAETASVTTQRKRTWASEYPGAA